MATTNENPSPETDEAVGIVVVSHSRPLGEAAAALALQMVPGPSVPRIKVAAGLDENTLGTDATAIQSAIEELSECRGILVMVDLGSAILSTEMALEFLDPDLASRVTISTGPLVEGLVVAVVTASTGADLDAVASETARALEPKIAQIKQN